MSLRLRNIVKKISDQIGRRKRKPQQPTEEIYERCVVCGELTTVRIDTPIAKGRWSGTADDIAKKIADGFRNSSGHWNYVGSADNSYIAVGCVYNASSGYWYCCVLVNNVNYG